MGKSNQEKTLSVSAMAKPEDAESLANFDDRSSGKHARCHGRADSHFGICHNRPQAVEKIVQKRNLRNYRYNELQLSACMPPTAHADIKHLSRAGVRARIVLCLEQWTAGTKSLDF